MHWFYKKLLHEELKSDEVLFEFLIDLINRKDLINLDLLRLDKAKSLSFEEYKCESVAVYFALEKFIVEHTTPEVKKVYNQSALREEIKNSVSIDLVNERIQVVFMDGLIRKIFLYELYIKALVENFTSALGSRELKSVYDKNFANSPFGGVEISKHQFDFSKVNDKIFSLPEEEIEEIFVSIQDACRGSILTLYGITENVLGEEFAKKAATAAFDSFAKFYDYGIIRSILEILPSSLSETQRLIYLSREELESEVEVKSMQLNKAEKERRQLAEKMSRELEIKVQERTKDLNIFKLAVESASDHIIIADKEGKIIYANKAAEKITGYSLDEMVGKTPALWGGEMSREFYDHLWRTISKERKPFESEIKNRRKNGEKYTVEAHITPISGEGTEEVFYVGIERDITKEKEVANMKSEFVSVASHQLRTPLTEIRWAFDALLGDTNEKLTETQRKICTSGMKSTVFTIGLVNDLLSVSKLSEQGVEFDMTKQSIVELSTKMYNVYKQIADKKGVDLTLTLAENVPEVSIDKKQMGMAISNFVDNAITYTNSGATVELSVKSEVDKVVVEVSDTGIGVPSTQVDNLFSKFFRANNAKLLETDGSGLGLYIAKTIIEEHGGSIEVDSVLEKGTKFTIKLPIEYTGI